MSTMYWSPFGHSSSSWASLSSTLAWALPDITRMALPVGLNFKSRIAWLQNNTQISSVNEVSERLRLTVRTAPCLIAQTYLCVCWHFSWLTYQVLSTKWQLLLAHYFQLLLSVALHNAVQNSSDNFLSYPPDNRPSFCFSFGVAVNAEADMTIHSQSWALIREWPITRVPIVCAIFSLWSRCMATLL